tara:strand:- start:797 stop:1420 length:624 start_codon:yes stop_codon:yes gene_type:complete
MTQQEIEVFGIGTPRTLRVHWALRELQLDYTTRPIKPRTPQMDAADFLAVSPGKKIPALRHGSLVLTESGAITRFLMDHYAARKWSASERARIDRLTFFVLMGIDATALYVIRRHEGLPAIYGEAPGAVAAAYAYADRQFAVLADLIGRQRHAIGEQFSEADIHAGSVLDWALALKIDLPANLTEYHERLRARPAYVAARDANAMIL